jgi:hypothetical protein
MTQLVFIIQAYEEQFAGGDLGDVCTVELIDESAEKAINRAKKLINKKNYRVKSIIEMEKGKEKSCSHPE